MKNILMIATGGTIASNPQGSGLTPTMTGEELAACVPEIEGLCNLTIVQPMNIDSTNMRPRNWIHLRNIIVEEYDNYDGFVILHGTDTMSYTAAALSYLIQDSPKPIVLTGSQQPMSNPFTDAKLNVYQSLLYATDDLSRDVCVVFGGRAIAGTRARKQRTMSFDAFISVNFPVLAIIRNDKIIRSGLSNNLVPAPSSAEKDPQSCELKTYSNLNSNVIVLKLTPELNPSIFELLQRDYDAVILETYGIGGIPEHEDASFEKAINAWVDSGRTIVLTTQVPEEGLDLGVYEVGRAYANNPGILKGDDMTTEALVAKTMWALGQSHDQKTIHDLFYSTVNFDRVPQM